MKFTVKNAAQIEKAEVQFGDMTVFVGEQGTGKSIFLQLLKLCIDEDYIKQTLSQNANTWKKTKADLLKVYLGNSTESLWDNKKSVAETETGKSFLSWDTDTAVIHQEQMLYIPAHRATTMPLVGWPTAFRMYRNETPFVLRNFSERFRLYLENQAGKDKLFPLSDKLNLSIRDSLDAAIFHNATISQQDATGQKELKLTVSGETESLPYFAWSTGQREFVPLLLGCYELLPKKDKNINYIVIEEPEMGLHPKAIFATMLLFLDLLKRGYKVIISTHSLSVLDVVWAIRNIAKAKITKEKKVALLLKLFDIDTKSLGAEQTQEISDILAGILSKTYKTYYFTYNEKLRVIAKDISTLDPSDELIGNWGGLSGYSGRAADIVCEAYNGE